MYIRGATLIYGRTASAKTDSKIKPIHLAGYQHTLDNLRMSTRHRILRREPFDYALGGPFNVLRTARLSATPALCKCILHFYSRVYGLLYCSISSVFCQAGIFVTSIRFLEFGQESCGRYAKNRQRCDDCRGFGLIVRWGEDYAHLAGLLQLLSHYKFIIYIFVDYKTLLFIHSLWSSKITSCTLKSIIRITFHNIKAIIFCIYANTL